MLNDTHDEDEETLTLSLSDGSGGIIDDDQATGTDKNHDPLSRALLARFGPTAAVHVGEQVEERISAPREPGIDGRFAGRDIRKSMERDVAHSFLKQLGGMAGAGAPGTANALGRLTDPGEWHNADRGAEQWLVSLSARR